MYNLTILRLGPDTATSPNTATSAPQAREAMFTAYCLAICRLAKQGADHSIAAPPSRSAPCALKPGRATEATHQTGDGLCGCDQHHPTTSNNTAASRYADSEAQKRIDIRIVEHRLRAERMATDRLTRATDPLVWTTGVLAIATIALVVVTLSTAK